MPTHAIRNGVLIILDSVRADHLGCYGHAHATSPNLDALAAQGTRFDRCYAQSNLTPGSVTTLFTGTPPGSHGVQDFTTKPRGSVSTLAEVLGRDGVHSCMVSSWAIFGSEYPMTRGFAECTVRDEVRDGDVTAGDAITETTLDWLGSRRGERFFLCLHYGDAHIPYSAPCKGAIPPVEEPPSRIRGLWREPSRLRQAVMKVLLLPDWERRHPLLATFGRRIYELGVIAMHPVPRAMHAINRRGVPVSDAEKAYIGYRYEQCIHHLDSHIGGIVGYLDSTGLIEDTAVIVTADHGDELFERGRLGHGRTLYEELIHVPLIAHFPGRDAPIGVWHEPVRHVDVMPTIAEALGIQSDGCVSGRSLLRGLEDDPFQPGPVFSEGVAPNGSSACMIDGNLKVILNDTTDSPELYDLEVDPGERMDLASTQLGEAERLAAKLRGVVASAGVAAEDRPEAFEIPAEVEKRLRDLGYW